METKSSKDAAGKAIKTENISINICNKYVSKTEANHKSVTFPANKLEATIKVEGWTEIHAGSLVKSELVEFDHTYATTDISAQTSTTLIVLEKIPKTETKILSDSPNSTTDEMCDLYHNDNYNEDNDSNFDLECDPFAEVECDPRFSKIPLCNNTNDSATQIQFLNTHEVTSCHETSKTNQPPKCKLKRFKCQLCPSTYVCCGDLSKHMRSHENQRPFKCPIPNCGKAFNFKNVLQNHILYVHSNERSFKCQQPNCSKTFKINGQLNRHMLSHSEETRFQCPQSDCYKSFKSKASLKLHLRAYTGSFQCEEVADGPFKCTECGGAFAKNWQLSLHLTTHAVKIFECPESNCDRQFKSKRCCESHVVNVHQEPVPLYCAEPNCEKIFKNKKSLRAHLASSHTKKSVALLKCTMPNCDKKYKTKGHLTEHIKCHTRPHECMEPGCSATFARPRGMKLHVLSKHRNIAARKRYD